jgi:hypothetical protein
MPPVERDRLHGLISKEAWAKADLARQERSASTGDGFAAAFLYAVYGDPRNAAIAQRWLVTKYGKNAYWIVRAADRLKGEFFKGGQVGIPEVYYDTDLSGYLAFDWVHKGLEATARKEIEDGIVLWSRYKMRAMNRWTQTANLVFKPTSTVALAGLATDNKELMEWGFRESTNTTVFRAGDTVVEAPVWLGAQEKVPLVVSKPVQITAPSGQAVTPRVVARFDGPIAAPIAKGTKLGTAVVTLPDNRVVEYPLEAGADVPRMGVFGRVTTMIQHYHEVGLGKGQQAVREQHDCALLCVRLRRAAEEIRLRDGCVLAQGAGRLSVPMR